MKIIVSDEAGQIFYEGSPNLHGNGIIIGSSDECDIQIQKMGVASKQLHLRYNADGALALHDLHSPLGTIVNGEKLQSGFIKLIKPGSQIKLTDELFLRLQPEIEDIQHRAKVDPIFPFFINSNEQFIRNCFSKARKKISRDNYSAIAAIEGEIVTKVRELSAVLEITYALNSINSFHRLLDFTLEMAITVTGAERALIMLYNDELKRLEIVATHNFLTSELDPDTEALAPITEQCFNSGKTIIGKGSSFKKISTRKKSPDEVGIQNLALVPLKDLTSNIGILYVDTKRSDNVLTSRTEQLLKIFASQAAVAISRAKMLHIATSDVQTGIANQSFFLQRLGEEFCRAQRHQKPISLILMDLDHFSKINENHGKNNGDRLLKEVGKIFKSATRIHDLVARYGPDSFAMILPETQLEGAKIVAAKLKEKLEQLTIKTDKNTIFATGSFGIGTTSAQTTKPISILRMAEKNLLQAKKLGGKRVI